MSMPRGRIYESLPPNCLKAHSCYLELISVYLHAPFQNKTKQNKAKRAPSPLPLISPQRSRKRCAGLMARTRLCWRLVANDAVEHATHCTVLKFTRIPIALCLYASPGGQPTDVGLSVITMLAICANLAWTALYVNSDSPAAALFPLLLGVGLLRGRPHDGPRLDFIEQRFTDIRAYKLHYSAFAWGVIFAVVIAVCASLARAAEGIALDVQLAASNGEVSSIKRVARKFRVGPCGANIVLSF